MTDTDGDRGVQRGVWGATWPDLNTSCLCCCWCRMQYVSPHPHGRYWTDLCKCSLTLVLTFTLIRQSEEWVLILCQLSLYVHLTNCCSLKYELKLVWWTSHHVNQENSQHILQKTQTTNSICTNVPIYSTNDILSHWPSALFSFDSKVCVHHFLCQDFLRALQWTLSVPELTNLYNLTLWGYYEKCSFSIFRILSYWL